MPTLLYQITPADPHAHLFEVLLTIPSPALQGQTLSLPAWIPGSYMIREFAKNIVTIEASCEGKRLKLGKQDKQTWLAAKCPGPLMIRYQIYAWDLSVRTAHLDANHGFFNGSSVFLRVHGLEEVPHRVHIKPAAGYEHWKVATALARVHEKNIKTKPWSFGVYEAPNYDALIDHPVEMGTFVQAHFEACGAAHEIVVTGHVPNLDLARLQSDFAKICTAQIQLFEPKTAVAPFLDSSDRYVFMTQAWGDGNYGGLEHRASTALVCSRNDLPVVGQETASDAYRAFLGLVSHEYFHTWNVKRIKPAVFAPYQLEQENYTPLLWLFEGFTSYYDDLILLRCGLMSEEQYLRALAKTISGVLRSRGRLKQSVADSSFDAWTKYYRQDENSPNAIVSYYTKGSLLALYLDLLIRTQTQGKYSLDDFMRHLWIHFGRNFYKGQPRGVCEQEIAELLLQSTTCDLRKELKLATETTQDLPLERLFAGFGIAWSAKPERSAPSLGIRTRSSTANAAGECVIATAFEGEAAHRSGLSALDILIAIDGLRVTANNLDTLLTRYQAGDTVRIHAFRRDELIAVNTQLDPPGRHTISLSAMEKVPLAKKRLRKGWLRG